MSAPRTADTVPSPLRALKRRVGDLELSVLHAAQVGERGVRAGCGPTREELEEAMRVLDAAVAAFDGYRRRWAERTAGQRTLPCLACALARGRGDAAGCGTCGAGEVQP